MTQVGWDLVEVATARVVQYWGDEIGRCAGLPDRITLPNGTDHIHCPRPGDDYSGYVLTPRLKASPPLTEADFSAAIEGLFEETSRSLGYVSADRLATYVSSTIAKWREEAVAFVAWRDLVLVKAYEILAAVQSGQRQAPSVSAFLAELPAVSWPQSSPPA